MNGVTELKPVEARNPVALTTAKGFTTTLREEEQDEKSTCGTASVNITKLKRAHSKYRRYLQRMDSQTSSGTREHHHVLSHKRNAAENLKGVKTQLSIIKVGGESENVDTFKCKLPLIDE